MDLPPQEPAQSGGMLPLTPLPESEPAHSSASPASLDPTHPRGGIQGRNPASLFPSPLPALLVLACACLVIIAQPLLPRPGAEEAAPVASPEERVTSGSSAGVEELRERSLAGLLGWVLGNPLVQISMLACACMALGWVHSPQLRQEWRLGFAMPRPLPSIYMLDLLALFAVLFAVTPGLTWVLIYVTPEEWWRPIRGWWAARDAAGVAFNLLAQFLGYSAALTVALLLARQHGGESGGTDGIWPFWKLRGAANPRDIKGDLGLGLAAYGLFFWVISLAAILNLYVLWKLGWEKIDQNPLVLVMTREAAGPGRFGLLALLALSAGVGAAFFEELIFRGVLYNVLKRHMGPWPGAIAAALAFSLIHRVHSNILPLFVLGLLLTWLYERTGRLLAPMVLHSINNAMAITVLLLQVSK